MADPSREAATLDPLVGLSKAWLREIDAALVSFQQCSANWQGLAAAQHRDKVMARATALADQVASQAAEIVRLRTECTRLSSGIVGRIDYALGDANDQELSLHDVDKNDDRVLARVQELVAEIARLREKQERVGSVPAPETTVVLVGKVGATELRNGRATIGYEFTCDELDAFVALVRGSVPVGEPLEQQASRLRALWPGWDSYGGLAIDERAIAAAVRIASAHPQLVPCSDGGVQIEWRGEAEVKITPDGTQEFEAPRGEEVERVVVETLFEVYSVDPSTRDRIPGNWEAIVAGVHARLGRKEEG